MLTLLAIGVVVGVVFHKPVVNGTNHVVNKVKTAFTPDDKG